MPDALGLQEIAERRISVAVVDHHVARGDLDRPHHGDRQVPEAGAVVGGRRVEARELAEVVDRRGLGREEDGRGEGLAPVGEGLEFGLQRATALLAIAFGRLAVGRAIQLLADRVLAAGQAVGHQCDPAPHGLEEGVDDGRGVVEDDPVLDRRALEGDAGGLGRAPALAVVDAPGMDDDDGGSVGAEAVRHLDDAPGVVGEPPGPDHQVGVGVVDQRGRLEPGGLADGLDELRVVRQDGA